MCDDDTLSNQSKLIVNTIVSSLKEEFKILIDKSNSELNERLTKIEQQLHQILYGNNTTPSISLINTALQNNNKKQINKKFQPQTNSNSLKPNQTHTKHSRRSKSVSKNSCPYDIIPDLNDIKPLSVKELQKKDNKLFAHTDLITLHFLYKYKKVAILSFPSGTKLISVKNTLNQELKKAYSFTLDKLILSTKRITDDDLPNENKENDNSSLKELGYDGHQLIHCYGINSREQKRARTMTNTSIEKLKPKIILSQSVGKSGDIVVDKDSELDLFQERKKKSHKRPELSKDVVFSNRVRISPIMKRKRPRDTTLSPRFQETTDEFANLQKLVSDFECDSLTQYQLPNKSPVPIKKIILPTSDKNG